MTINLLKEDIPIEKIVGVTGLSEEDIKNVEINKYNLKVIKRNI